MVLPKTGGEMKIEILKLLRSLLGVASAIIMLCLLILYAYDYHTNGKTPDNFQLMIFIFITISTFNDKY